MNDTLAFQAIELQKSYGSVQALRGVNDVDWQYVNLTAERLNLNLKLAIKNLSKGNKQKVGIIQALMHQPALLLLDEPTVGLDPLMQKEVLQLIREARQRGATIFCSSHILSEVQAISDRVAIIRSGVVIEVAEIASLMRKSLRKVSIRFRQRVDIQALLTLPGIQLIEGDGEADYIVLQVEGERPDSIR